MDIMGVITMDRTDGDLRKIIEEAIEGIDKDQTDREYNDSHPDMAWWETSEQAKYGAEVKQKILYLLEAYETSQERIEELEERIENEHLERMEIMG